MKGTEKQIASAQEILRGAKIWHRPDGPGRGASQMAAIAAIEALEAGRLEEAEEALQEAAPWVELAIVEVDGRPAVSSRQSIEKEIDMSKTYITITNPWSGALVELDISDLSTYQFDSWFALMDDDVCEQLSEEMAPCTPAEFVAAYVDRVGPDAAGQIILGS